MINTPENKIIRFNLNSNKFFQLKTLTPSTMGTPYLFNVILLMFLINVLLIMFLPAFASIKYPSLGKFLRQIFICILLIIYNFTIFKIELQTQYHRLPGNSKNEKMPYLIHYLFIYTQTIRPGRGGTICSLCCPSEGMGEVLYFHVIKLKLFYYNLIVFSKPGLLIMFLLYVKYLCLCSVLWAMACPMYQVLTFPPLAEKYKFKNFNNKYLVIKMDYTSITRGFLSLDIMLIHQSNYEARVYCLKQKFNLKNIKILTICKQKEIFLKTLVFKISFNIKISFNNLLWLIYLLKQAPTPGNPQYENSIIQLL